MTYLTTRGNKRTDYLMLHCGFANPW